MRKLLWTTVQKRVNDLIPQKVNPRKITDKQMSDLKKSLQKYNLVEIPAIDTDGKILAGHQRVLGLQLLGRGEEIIDVRQPNRKLTEKEAKQYLIASNKLGGDWDYDLLKSFDLKTLQFAGFEDFEISKFWDKDIDVIDDNFDFEKEIKIAERNVEVKRGDIYQLGKHRLTCNDATDPNTVKKLMNGVQVDLVDIDLPFNIGLSYNHGVGGVNSKKNYGGQTNDSKTDDEYKNFVKSVVENSLSVIRPSAHVFFWCDENWVWLFQTVFKELNIKLKRLLAWIKNNSSPTPQVAFNKAMEYIVYGTIGSPYLSPNVKNANEIINPETTNGNELLEEVSNIILQKRLPSNQYLHPTQKDPQVHSKILKRCSKIGDIVLDLTAGSGSIMSACEQLGRIAYMCDYEPVFCQVILNRYKKLTGLNPTKIYEEK